jgi:hypothetical protein
MDNKSQKLKTRDLSAAQFFETLQLEYLICELRAKIYPQKHKDYWRGIAENKKERILDISKRNHDLPCIFSHSFIKEDFQKKVFPEVGFPKFIYRDEAQRLRQERWDWVNYYSVGCSVRIYDNSFFVGLGEVKRVDYENKTAIVLFENEEKELSLHTLTRLI